MPAPAKRSRARSSSGRAATTAARPVPTGAEAAVAQLRALGVQAVFGVPGVHNLALFDALRRSSIRTVLVRHEQTCVYAADGYARATGLLGVALTTTGPGAANAAAAMGEAKASRSAVLHISTQATTKILENRSGRFSLHESPHQRELMDAVSVWSASVARAEAIPSLIATGARNALSGRRGPSFLEVPHDLLDHPVSWQAGEPLRGRPVVPDQRSFERAVATLDAVERPVLWVGGGAVSARANEQVAKLAELLDAPVVTTFAGKGIVPRDHPLAVGLPPHQPEVTELIASSDSVVIVGSDLDGMSTQGWRLPFPRPRVALNTIAEDGRRNYACDVVVEADARVTLDRLLGVLATRPVARKRGRTPGEARTASARAAATRSLARKRDTAPGYGFVTTLEASVPSDVFVIGDMAVGGYWAAAYWRAPAPRSFAFPLGWGTLGFALPASVGVAVSGRRALVITGDAGVAFGLGELGTLVQEDLPVCVLVVNDGGYGMLRYDEKERFGDTFSTELRAPDFVALAKSFGMRARRVELGDLDAAIRWAFKRGGPSLIELRAEFAPPVSTSPRWPLRDRPEARP